MFWFSIKLNTETLRLSIGGDLDGTTLPDLETMLDRIVTREPWQVEMELSRLRMIDTIGVGALVRFSKRLRLSGCLLIVTGLRDQPALVFRLLGLDRRLAFGSELHWS